MLLIIGFATKRVVESALKEHKDIKYVIIIEPEVGVFKQTIRREYIGDVANSKYIELIAGAPLNELPAILYKQFCKQDALGSRIPYSQGVQIIIDPFAYPNQENGEPHLVAKEIIRITKEAQHQVILSMGCASDSYSRWEQTVRNKENIKSAYACKSLFGKFQDVPAIVVGGGPSTETFIKAYKEYNLKDKALILACDAALPRLQREEIKPHIVTRCERKLTTIFNKVRKAELDDVFYAAYTWTPPEFFNLFKEKMIMYRGNGINHWTEVDHGEVNGGVSAANAALELACMMGCQTIFMTGIDLCFIGEKSHMSGTEVEFDIEKSKPKWKKIPGNSGEVTTIPVWYRCLQEYGLTTAKHQKVKFFNTSLEGAKINGTEVMAWNGVAEKLTKKFDVVDIIRSNIQKPPPSVDLDKKFKDAISFLKEVQQDLTKLFLFIEDAMAMGAREEQRCTRQLGGGYMDPKPFFDMTEAVQKSLMDVYKEPMRQIVQFRSKWYPKRLFCQLVLDICAIDFYMTETRELKYKGEISRGYERLKQNIANNMSFLKLLDFYVEKQLSLFEKGPDPKEYPFEKEVLEAD